MIPPDPAPQANSDLAADRFGLPSTLNGSVAALVVAHPGHELRVFGWLCTAHPDIFVLTDGSGHTGLSRLGATTSLIEKAGAKPGCLYGRFTDIDIYSAVLDHDSHFFTNLAEELAGVLQKRKVRYVVGDAIEGYNPVHDICRIIIDSAVRLARRRVEHEIDNFDFLVVGHPATPPHESNGRGAIYLKLNEELHVQKLEAATAYSALSGDVDQALSSFGPEAFRVECLRPASDAAFAASARDGPPFYEQYGAKQVAAGYYNRVVRYREHMLPLFASLDHYVEQSV